jgi:hypothetical protein
MANLTTAAEPELIAHFNEIGRATGAYADPAQRSSEYRFWQQLGAAGAGWLILRVEHAQTLTQAWGIADVLAAIGPAAIDPICESLAANPSEELADVLLSAIGGMSPTRVEPWADVIAGNLRVFLRHPDDAVRSKAVAATSILPAATALTILTDRRGDETDDSVLSAIDDEIARRS